jgi:AraC-like DNA-binding protein
MESAQRLLTRTSRPVQQIASVVGYDDVQAFARVFRKFSGCSASGFRAGRGGTASRAADALLPDPGK